MSNKTNLEKAAALQQQLGDFCKENGINIFSTLSTIDLLGKIDTRAVVGGDVSVNMQSVMKISERVLEDSVKSKYEA